MAKNINPFFTTPIKKEGQPVDYGAVDLSEESLTQAIEKIRGMVDTGVLSNQPATMTMATTGRYNLGTTTNGTSPITLGANTNAEAKLTVHGRPVEIKPFEVNATMEMLEDASSPYNIDPETLSNLWIVRFGKGWVGNEAVEDTEDDVDWWRHCANRLRELGYLEMHTLASSYRIVMRIVE